MDFAYTPAQLELKARAAEYAQLLMKYEDEAESAGGPLPRETVALLTQAAMDAGVYGINMPVAWGGAGLTLLEQVIVEEEFGKVTNCLWDIPWRPSNVLALASPEQRERYLLPILRGERFDAFATTEPDAGSDAGAISTTATPVEGGWVINGEKWFVTCGDVADFLLVQANVLPGNESTLFFVEKDTPGVRISRTPHFMHSAVNGHPEFVFEDVFVPTDAVLGRGRPGLRAHQGLVHRRAADDRRPHRRRGRARPLPRPRLGDPAQAVRRTDQRLPDDPGDARRLCGRHRGQPRLHPPGRLGGRQRRRPEDTPREGLRSPSSPPARRRGAWSTGACRSSAVAATTGPTRSSGCTARSASTASGKVRRRSSASSSPTS